MTPAAGAADVLGSPAGGSHGARRARLYNVQKRR